MMNQRFFAFFRYCILFCVLALAAGSAFAQVRVRIAAANTTSGNAQSYLEPGTRIFQGLKPDVVCLQEFKVGNSTTAEIQAWVQSTFGAEYTYFRESGSGIPNGVISRYPILASGEWDDTLVSDRDFAWARIDVPGPIDLYAVSVHLLTTSATNRDNESKNLVQLISANFPANAFLVIAGDYNTSSRSEACYSTLSAKVVTSSPYPADQEGNQNTNASRAKPYDNVMVNSALNAYKTAVKIGSSTYTNGLVFDSRVYTPLSEVSPVLYDDSGATNMQHMAVVKDFLIPGDPTQTPTATPSSTAYATASSTPSPSYTSSPSPTASPSSTPSPTPSATASPSLTPSATLSPSPTRSPSPSISLSPSPTASPSFSPTATVSNTPAPSQSPTAAPSGSPSPSPAATATPGITPTFSAARFCGVLLY